ncbi:MAG: circadian clock protein KaiC [Solirubrobacteraceae bacterium]
MSVGSEAGGSTLVQLRKAPTGIGGLDSVTDGGLPRARTTLLCGGPGCGKTLLAMQFLVRGALDSNEPGVFIAFEEAPNELAQNVASLGWDLEDLQQRGLLAIDQIKIAEGDIVETGDWDLDGLFIRLGLAIDSVGAKRVVLDTIEALFGRLGDEALLRSELRRLFSWLNDRGVTAIVTGERGDSSLTRHGLEEYVSDCVITLDHRVHNQISTRTLRVVKYRGSHHGPDEYPFLIDRTGFSVVPVSTIGLNHGASDERVSTGVAELDAMLAGGGYFRGSSVLLSGTAGSGKSTLGARFLEAACQRGERAMLFAFEESPAQICRNMRSVGIDLEPWLANGLLRIASARPAAYGLETHLARMHQAIVEFGPRHVVLDPLSCLDGEAFQLKSVLTRMIDQFKALDITAVLTTLIRGSFEEPGGLGVSSVIDTWIDVSNVELDGERNRGINVLKSRGMAHSNQVREFLLGADGILIQDVYDGERGVLMGSARRSQEARDRAELTVRTLELDAKRSRLDSRRSALEAQIAGLRDELASETLELSVEIEDEERRKSRVDQDRRARKAIGGRGASPVRNGHGEPAR